MDHEVENAHIHKFQYFKEKATSSSTELEFIVFL